MSTEFSTPRQYTNGFGAVEENPANNGTTPPPQWSSAVGKANLGKSGRVIERLMGENDMLKRDLKLEQLRSEESRQAVKMVEAKIEQLASDFESRLHDASITKAQLKRKERQLSDLKDSVNGERARADAAADRERSWREAAEAAQREAKAKVDEAQNYAILMEGRNKALTSHWKQQGDEVNRTAKKLGEEISTIIQERHEDYKRMELLQGLCDQQAKQLEEVCEEKERIMEAFAKYKIEQEQGLADIKQRSQEQELSNAQALKETEAVLGELRWALNVKKNVKDTQ
jgi:uncharacterized protein YeeX (DUF496 family)